MKPATRWLPRTVSTLTLSTRSALCRVAGLRLVTPCNYRVKTSSCSRAVRSWTASAACWVVVRPRRVCAARSVPARQMVAMYGMSERLGLAHCAQRQPTFLNGQEFQIQRDCSEQTAREMDEEVKQLLGVAYDQAKQALGSDLDQLELVAAELLKSETIDSPTFYRLVSQEMPSLKDPRPLAGGAALESKKKSKLVGHAM